MTSNVQIILNVNAEDFHNDPSAISKFFEDLNLPHVTPNVKTVKKSASEEMGPLAKLWCELNSLSQIRRTNGRSSEEQARHNLKTYMDYTDADIDVIIGRDSDLVQDDNTIDDTGVENEPTEEELF